MSEETCPDCGRKKCHGGEDWAVAWGSARKDEVAGLCGKHLPSYWSDESIPDCERATTAHLRSQLSAATARASELERALATETKAREMSWAHHDEHHERDAARWLKMCQALGKVTEDGSPGIAWPAIFELVAAMGERVARAELQLKALDLLCAFASETEAHVSLYVLDGGLRRVEVGSIWTNGDSAGSAALILAAGHGLLQPETKGT